MLFYFKYAWCDVTVKYGLLQMMKHMHQYRDERASLHENFLYRKSTNRGLVNSLQFYRHDARLSGVGLIITTLPPRGNVTYTSFPRLKVWFIS